jgi:ATP-dependent DNA helicase RecQ
VAPETLLRPETMVLLDECQVDCLAIDEAHCISSWGHDFRPVYRQLISVRQRWPQAVCFALTATATRRVQTDIKEALGIRGANEFLASFNRENLFLEVQPKSDGWEQLLNFLEQHRDQSGIIYCATRKGVDELAEELAAQGWSVLPYHAGMESVVRRRHQRQFSRDEVQIVVATIAFGMGIDKSNVRFIVHYNLPKDIESYYQEIGRSGRDGLRADCLLLFNNSDAQTIRYFITQMKRDERPGAYSRLKAMVDYAESNICRRRPLITYFGEAYDSETCDMCDNCLRENQELADITIPAQKFLSCVKRTGEMYGPSYIGKVLRGSKAKTVLANRHDQLSTYGIGREYTRKQWTALGQQLVSLDLLSSNQHGGLRLTAKAHDVFKGEAVMGTDPGLGAKRIQRPEKDLDYNQELFNILRDKRREVARASGVPPYIIFSDRSLVEMSAYYPQSREAFSIMYGVGWAKLENYAGEFLPLIKEYCKANQIEEITKSGRSRRGPRKREGVSSRTGTIARKYASGRSIAQIADDEGFTQGTILNHLSKYLQAGNSLPASGFLEASNLSGEKQAQVLAAFKKHGPDYLRPVYDALGETVSYDEIKIMRMVYLSKVKD